jgi:hypothetical protein
MQFVGQLNNQGGGDSWCFFLKKINCYLSSFYKIDLTNDIMIVNAKSFYFRLLAKLQKSTKRPLPIVLCTVGNTKYGGQAVESTKVEESSKSVYIHKWSLKHATSLCKMEITTLALWVRAEPFDCGAIHTPLPPKLTLHVSKLRLSDTTHETVCCQLKSYCIWGRIWSNCTLNSLNMKFPTLIFTFKHSLIYTSSFWGDIPLFIFHLFHATSSQVCARILCL